MNGEVNGTARAVGNDKKSLRKNQSCSKMGRREQQEKLQREGIVIVKICPLIFRG
jgi:hypothetical protein